MKIAYTRPAVSIEHFAANEFIAGCTYDFNCNAAPKVGKSGYLFEDKNNNGRLDSGDRLVNRASGSDFHKYNPCGKIHSSADMDFKKGFVVSLNAFNNAKGWFWDWGNEEAKRTNFNFQKFGNDPVPVWIWDSGRSSSASVGQGWHATTTQPQLNHS